MKFPYEYFVLFLLIGTISSAQSTFNVSGQIVDANNEGFPFANVLLLRSTDSTLVKGSLTNEEGTYLLEGVPSGSYYLQSTFLGFQSVSSEEFRLADDIEFLH